MIKLKDILDEILEGTFSHRGDGFNEDPADAEAVVGMDEMPNPVVMHSEKGGTTIHTSWIGVPRSKFYKSDVSRKDKERQPELGETDAELPLGEAIYPDYGRPKNVPQGIKKLWKQHDEAFALEDRIGLFANRNQVKRLINVVTSLHKEVNKYYKQHRNDFSLAMRNELGTKIATAENWLVKAESMFHMENLGKAVSYADMIINQLHLVIDFMGQSYDEKLNTEALYRQPAQRPKDVPKEIQNLWKIHDEIMTSSARHNTTNPHAVKTFGNMVKSLEDKVRNYWMGVKNYVTGENYREINNIRTHMRISLKNADNAFHREQYDYARAYYDGALSHLHSVIDYLARWDEER